MIQTNTVNYEAAGINCEGFIAFDDSNPSPRPGILVVHDWTGRTAFTEEKAAQLAQMGYVGFAVDMYGNGQQGSNNDEKAALMMPLIENRESLQQRIQAAMDFLQAQPQVDANNIAIIGFCFGGLCALDLARTGANIKGAVSFHGNLTSPDNITNPKISAKVLALHGYADPMVPPEQVAAFADEMTNANVDWQLHAYGNTLHAFTNPLANDRDFGTVYDATAAQRSWLTMQNFFAELF